MHQLAVQDWIVLAYLVVLVIVAFHAAGSSRDACIRRTSMLLAAFVAMLLAVRGGLLRERVAAVAYRLVIYGVVQISYFVLRDLLPLANPRTYDASLHRIDVSLFGVEPTLWMDRFVSPTTTEWFAFFYYGYFFLLASHVWPMLLLCRRRRLLAEFGLAVITLFCAAHALYLVVPGFGPIRHLAEQYTHPLPRGLFYDLVLHAVERGGAQKDIFPSLHTAAPVMLALFAYRHRREPPFRFTWLPTAAIALNIMAATIFLRWHWAIDVLAGFALAVFVLAFAERVARWEHASGRASAWPSYG